jgi:hypothetical protein
MSRWILTLAFVAAVFGTSETAFAQNAQVTGTLVDQSGGVLPGVTVTARNQETGLVRTTISEGNGEYRLAALPPGTYTVTAELQGFNVATRTDLVLVIDQNAVVNFTLTPATLEETVTVTGEAPLVDTRTAVVSTAVTNAQIQDLPVASRRWVDLASTAAT